MSLAGGMRFAALPLASTSLDQGRSAQELATAAAQLALSQVQYLRVLGMVAVALGFLPLFYDILRREHRRDLKLLGMITLLGALLRLIPDGAIFAAWDYNRVWRYAILLRQVSEMGLVPFAREWPLWDAVFAYNWLLGSLSVPLAYFHLRVWMGSPRRSMAVALLLACLPAHIKFTASNASFIESFFWNSLALIALHVLAQKASLWRQCYAYGLFLLVFWINFFTRFLNVLFFPLYVLAFVLLYGEGRGQRKIYWGMFGFYVLAGAAQIARYLAMHDIGFIAEEGPSLLGRALYLFSPWVNAFLNPFTSPPWIALLAGLGAWQLWREGQWRWLGLLLGWYGLFFLSHTVVIGHAFNQARYNLHMTGPALILAAVGLAALPRVRPEWSRKALALTLAAPLIYLPFILAQPHNRQREFRFLQSHVAPLLPAATVLEADPMVGMQEPALWSHGFRLHFHERRHTEAQDVRLLRQEQPLPDVNGAYLYLGYRCSTWQPGESGMNPWCEELLAAYDLEPVAESTWTNRCYDPVFFAGVDPDERFPVRVSLWRVRGMAQCGEGRQWSSPIISGERTIR